VTFASILRPQDHPTQPVGARSNDNFWRRDGHAALEGATVHFGCKDLGNTEETDKVLQVWMKPL